MDNQTTGPHAPDAAAVKFEGPQIKHIGIRNGEWFVAYLDGSEAGPFANAWEATRSAPREVRRAYFAPGKIPIGNNRLSREQSFPSGNTLTDARASKECGA